MITGWLLGSLAAAIGVAGMLMIGGCSPLVTLNEIMVPSSGYTYSAGNAYGPDGRHRLDVYTPDNAGAAAGETRPVVVFFYGGSWRGGQRTYYRFMGEALASKGFVAVVPDYRVYPEVVYPAFVEDGALAVRWVRDNIQDYGGDPDRIILAGHSAGAHIAAMLVAEGRFLREAGVPAGSIRGLVGLAGPYAFDPFSYRTTRPIFASVNTPEQMHPGTYVDGDEPPMLLLHGTSDRTVYPVNTRKLAEQVRAVGGTVRVDDVEGVGHIGLVLAFASPFQSDGGVADRVAAFAWQYTAPQPVADDGAKGALTVGSPPAH